MSSKQVQAAGALLLALTLAGCQGDPASPDLTAGGQASARFDRAAHGEGYAKRGPERQGFILDRNRRPMEITYEVQEGLAIWQGDIVIGRANEIPKTPADIAPAMARGARRAIYIDGDAARWPGGVVPYTIDGGLAAAEVTKINTALAALRDSTEGITFVVRTSQDDYVTFRTADGCSSEIGRIGGQQFINFDTDCSTGNAVHEMIHALGFFHEQSRCDRDDFVTVTLANVESGKEHNFDKVCDGATDHGDYNEGSIMHYGTHFFSSNGGATLTSLRGRDGDMGQRSSIANTDRATLALLYGANNDAPTAAIGALAASYPEGSSVPFNGAGSTDPDDVYLTYLWNFGDGSCAIVPTPAACTEANPNHVYAQNGSYSVTLTVSDGTKTDDASTSVTVTNVAPVVDAGAATGTKDEGAVFSRAGSFTDPGADTWTATVNYGDGSGTQPLTLTGKQFTLSHTYVDNGAYTITVIVKDSDDATGTDGIAMTITNVAPTVSAGSDATLVSGETYTLSGTFTDPGVIDYPWSWTVNWGFGSNSTGSINSQPGPIVVEKQVCAAGTYNVVLSVKDKDNGTGSDNLALTVNYYAVTIDIMPTETPNPIKLGKKGLVPVALLSTATFDARTADPSTITLGNEVGTDTPVAQQRKGTYYAAFEDVNGDGRLDLVMQFDAVALAGNNDITAATTQLVLRGFGGSGACTNFRGVESVVIIP